MAMIDAMLMELEQEAQATRRLLERVPEEHLAWKPHPKSFSLGQIALHLAELPGGVSLMASQEVFDLPPFQQREAESRGQLMQAFEQGLLTARQALGALDDQRVLGTWQLQHEGQVLMSLPRIALLRSLLLNHCYHHRGQLTVYLRLLNIPLPSTYGPTADENPFGLVVGAKRPSPATV